MKEVTRTPPLTARIPEYRRAPQIPVKKVRIRNRNAFYLILQITSS
jgi:hypothetical protein